MILTKSKKLLVLIRVPGYNVQYILCRLADVVKNTPLTLKTWLKRVWQKVGGSHQDSTSVSSETPGEHKLNEGLEFDTGEDMLLSLRDKYIEKNKEYNKKVNKNKEVDEDAIRKAGW
jgi:hypothetical protein